MFRRCLYILLGCFATALPAQVHELWRVGLTNSEGVIYTTTTALVDFQANTVVGGIGFFGARAGATSVVIKFDSSGNKLWEFHTVNGDLINYGMNFGVEGLAVDAQGNIFITTRITYIRSNSIALVKLSPDGAEQWRIIENNAADSPFGSSVSAVKVDSGGNAYFMADISPFHFSSLGLRIVAKFDSQGRTLWRRTLPDTYLYEGARTRNSVAVTPDEGLLVVGGHWINPGVAAYATKLSANGDSAWWTDDYKGRDHPYVYTTALISPRGTVCASGDLANTTTFSANGKPLHTDFNFAAEVVDVAKNDDFILRQGNVLTALNSTGGHVRWQFDTGLSVTWGTVSDGADGWLLAGNSEDAAGSLVFLRLNSRGGELSRAALNNFPPGRWFSFDSLLRAPDGSFRAIVNLMPTDEEATYLGVGVIAFAVQ